MSAVLFNFWFIKESWKNGFHKNIKPHNICILEWFLKDHVTLKTGVIAAENSALPSLE